MSNYIKKTYAQMVVDSYHRAQDQDLRIEEIDDDHCLVVNVLERTVYNVGMSDVRIDDCDCPHHVYRGVPCKHMFAAAGFFQKSI